MYGERISELVGKTLARVENKDNEEIHFHTTDGEIYRLYHSEDCCEYVRVEEVVGNLDDLIGAPILEAEETSGSNDGSRPGYTGDSYTWTFYKLGTIKGHVTIRWLGESNGYYSEGVNFAKVN